MRKEIVTGLSLAALLATQVAFAATFTVLPTPPSFSSLGGLLAFIEGLGNWLFSGLLVVAVVMIVWAAFNFVTAGGDAAKVETARKAIMFAAIGVLVAVAAKGIVSVILQLVA